MQRINCRRCAYYFVTWEKSKPHGCKAYGFKSQFIPSQVVKQSSGTDCSYFVPKRPKSD
ncbi:MAG: uracil-DNA glycosylase [Campylobacterota bacterium]|nr:uracil-DNA glycosylase [Campylobacterota bacterium]